MESKDVAESRWCLSSSIGAAHRVLGEAYTLLILFHAIQWLILEYSGHLRRAEHVVVIAVVILVALIVLAAVSFSCFTRGSYFV